MKKKVRAILNWIPHSEGGRDKGIPVGVKYGPLIVFDGQDTNKQAWSAEIYIIENIDDFSSKIYLSYLSSEAPFNNLSSGNKFNIFEGKKLVATGIVE